MLSRLLWRITTPRALRRRTLAVLVAWLAVASAHQHGMFGESQEDGQVPVVVYSSTALR